MTHRDKTLQQSGSMEEYGRRYAAYLCGLVNALDYRPVTQLADILETAWEGGRTTYIAGNGGSAATASHWAVDLTMGTRVEGVRAFRALSLCDHTPLLTAIGNDRGYADIIVGQLEALFQPNDVLIAISASGNSPNILRAVEFANERGGITVGLTGFDGGRLRSLCRVCIHVATPRGEYGPVEDIHLILDHMVTGFLRERRLARAAKPSPAAGAERDR